MAGYHFLKFYFLYFFLFLHFFAYWICLYHLQLTKSRQYKYQPFSLFPDSVEYDDQRAKQVLFNLAAEAGSSDILIAYLPEASLGTALEMIRAYDSGSTIISISPMEKNWFILAVSNKIFSALDDFCDWISQARFSNLIEISPE